MVSPVTNSSLEDIWLVFGVREYTYLIKRNRAIDRNEI